MKIGESEIINSDDKDYLAKLVEFFELLIEIDESDRNQLKFNVT